MGVYRPNRDGLTRIATGVKVRALMLPSRYNASISLEDARAMAEATMAAARVYKQAG